MYVIPDVRTTMMVAGGIAFETTTQTFIANASAKEVQIFNEAGSAVPAYGENFFIGYKDVNGIYRRSNEINPKLIMQATVSTAVTPVPTYSYFTLGISGMAVNDQVQVLVNTYGFATSSWHQRLSKTMTEPFASGDTSKTLAAKLGIRIQESMAKTYESRPSYTVYNKAGYKAIYATQADAESDIGALTDGQLIWVIADSKPYTVAKSGGTAFADDFDEKTNWSSEITAGTAETVLDCKYLDVVQVADTSDKIYICCKVLTQDDERKFGYESPVYVGAQWLDYSGGNVKTDIGVTRVNEVTNPGDGKKLRNFEASIDRIQRPYGRFVKAAYSPVLATDTTASYTVLNLKYKMQDADSVHQLGIGNNNFHTLMIPFTSSADAANFLAAIAVTYTAATPADLSALTLNDLADVVTTGATDGEQLTYVDSTATWEPGASGV